MSKTTISSGVTSSGLYVRDGDILRVLSGGAVIDSVVLGGAALWPSPGSLIENIDVRSRGFVWGKGKLGGRNSVEGGTVANVTLVGDLTVTSGGRTQDVVVASGGAEIIYGGVSGGVMSGGVVSSGGLLQFWGKHLGSGEVLSGGTLQLFGSNGAGLVVEAGATVDFHTVIGKKLVYSGPVLSAATVLDGVTLLSGARLVLDSPVVVSGGVLSLTADAPVLAFVQVQGGRLVGPGAVDSAWIGGGSISGLDIVGRLTIEGGTGQADTVGKGAFETVMAGTVSGETILRGGTLEIEYPSFGTATSALGTVVKGGTLVDIGTASGTVLSSGSRELVSSAGRDLGTRILDGAVEVLMAGGQSALAAGSLISSGGLELASGDGTFVDAATVFAGGVLSVTQGGSVAGGLVLHGGTAIISGSAAAGQTVSFGASGTLELGNLPAFHAAISGLSTSAQKVDLDGFAFSTSETVDWVQSGTSGVLTVTDGGKVATLTLIGGYASGDFNLADDGHGGTFVFDPRSPAATTRLAQAAAGLPAAGLAGAGLKGGRFGAVAATIDGGGVAGGQAVVGAISSR